MRPDSRTTTLMSKKFYSLLLGGTLTMMVVSALLMSDSIIAGSVIGQDAVAGITLVTPMYSMAAFFGSVFSLGVPIVYSIEAGRFNKKAADQAFGFGVLMSAALGIFLFVCVTLFGGMYLRSCSPSEAVLAEAMGYLSWMRFTMLLLPFQMLIAEAVYADGDETVSTAANILQGAGNIAASVILSHIMGIRGIALASFAFYAVSLLLLLTHFLKKSNSLRFNLFFSVPLLRTVAKYSIIDASSYLFLAAFTAIMNSFVSSRFGPAYIIIVSALILSRELQMVFDGIGEAITPILSVYLGEECLGGVRKIYRLAEKTAVIEGVIVTIAMIISASFVPDLIGIIDPVLAEETAAGIRITALGSVFVSLLYLISSYYLLIEKIGMGLAASALRDALLPAAAGIVLGLSSGLNGMFAGLALAPAVSYLLLLLYIDRRCGRKNCPLFLEDLSKDAPPSELYELVTEPEDIIRTQKKVGQYLTEHGYDKRTVGQAKLLIEELFMLIREKNDDKAILCECFVALEPDGIRIITKDEGIIFDISEDDVTVTSLVSFAVSAYMEKLGQNRRHLTTMSFNRSAFLIRTGAAERR